MGLSMGTEIGLPAEDLKPPIFCLRGMESPEFQGWPWAETIACPPLGCPQPL